jgi:heme/copper-type cytochrome/quinol oxidase subunit 3
MNARTAWLFLVAVVAIFVALVAGAVMLTIVALSQADIVHQILLVGMGIVFVGSGTVLLVAELKAYAREHMVARSRTEA